ncbi:MAG: hypothetical protein HY240_11080 [Actinobacteria bacterium]|nr:hypothetical protein [Actinomycetota bacterium]
MRVVLGEGATGEQGTLRSILEAEGFDVVGQASDPEGLERVLTGVDPQVIVLDAEMSAATLLAVRGRAPGAGIVVVWPAGVSAGAADRQVETSRAALDLGEAVRGAVPAGRVRPKVPAVAPGLAEPATVEAAAVGPTLSPAARHRGDLAFTVAAASVAVLLVAAFVLARQPRSTLEASSPSPSPSVVAPPGSTGGSGPGGGGGPAPGNPATGGFTSSISTLTAPSSSTGGPGPSGGGPGGGGPSPSGGGPGGEVASGDHGGSPGRSGEPHGQGEGEGEDGHHGQGNSGHHGQGNNGHHGDGNSGHHGDGNSGHHGDGNSGHHGH